MVRIIHKIKERLKLPLPGQESQYGMAPMGRKEFANSVGSYRQAAVLCLIYPKNNKPHKAHAHRQVKKLVEPLNDEVVEFSVYVV